MGRRHFRLVSVPLFSLVPLLTYLHSASIRHAGAGQDFQMILSGPDVNYASLEAGRSLEAVQEEFNRGSGRLDLIIKEITNWQGEWR